jgi:hypothetical protein
MSTPDHYRERRNPVGLRSRSRSITWTIRNRRFVPSLHHVFARMAGVGSCTGTQSANPLHELTDGTDSSRWTRLRLEQQSKSPMQQPAQSKHEIGAIDASRTATETEADSSTLMQVELLPKPKLIALPRKLSFILSATLAWSRRQATMTANRVRIVR